MAQKVPTDCKSTKLKHMNLQSAASIKAFTDYIQNCKNFPKRVVEKIVADIKKNVEKIVAVMVE